jgi:hypothetical protein
MKMPEVLMIRLNTRKGEALKLRDRLEAVAKKNPTWTSPNEVGLFVLDAGLTAIEAAKKGGRP